MRIIERHLMSTVLLVRHGVTDMTGSVLTGHAPGVHLNERGRAQAAALAERIAVVPIRSVVSSPLERCLETAEAIAAAQAAAGGNHTAEPDERLIECRYGDWTGQPIKDLSRAALWRIVQRQPSAARFPHGESLAEVSTRAVEAIRDWDSRLGPDAVWVAVSHGDVIKTVLADALGVHLDQFQRIVVDPCSVSVIRYTADRPYVFRANDIGGDLADFAPKRRSRHRGATVGGGAGAGTV
jgi:probable phosphomutase (TIGR03848 family)